MTYAQLLTAINSALQGAGLTAAAEPRDGSLASAGRGNFDGCYLIINETGAQPWPDLALSPAQWRGQLRIEVGTELRTSVETQSQTVESRARAVFEALVYPTTAVARQLYGWDAPTITRSPQDKRLVWGVRFNARWDEP